MFAKRTAFAFLEDIKELFSQRYPIDVRLNALPNGMQTTFEDNLKAKMVYYNSQPENEKM